MIRGKVDDERQAWIQVEIRDSDGRLQSIDAVVDTGFDGYLTLPQSIIRELDLEPELQSNVILATGMMDKVNTWSGDVIWHDQFHSALILESAGVPLVGMELLEGSQLTIQVRANGDVNIEVLNED